MLYYRLTVKLKQIISNNKNHLYFLAIYLRKYFIIIWLVRDTINDFFNRALEIEFGNSGTYSKILL